MSLVLCRRVSHLSTSQHTHQLLKSNINLLRSKQCYVATSASNYVLNTNSIYVTLRSITSRDNPTYDNKKRFQHQSSVRSHSAVSDRDLNVTLTPYVDEKLSYVYGRSLKQLKYTTVSQIINSATEREPHSTAVVIYDEGISKNLEELRSDIYRLCNGLVKNFGVKRGDKIGVYVYNNYQFLVIQLACTVLGLVLNTFNPSYKSHEFSYVLGKSDIKLLFVPGKNSKQSSLNDHHSVICDKSIGKLQADGLLNFLTHIILLDGELKEEELSVSGVKVCHWRQAFIDQTSIEGTVQAMMEEVQSDDLYGVYYTSGTTGFPKGAAITQFNVINNALFSAERVFTERGPNLAPLRPNVCLPLPLFHEFAGVLGVMLPFLNGGSIVFTGARYNIQALVESIMRFKCNAIFLTPTILIDLITYVERNKLKNLPLKTMLIAGSKVLSELVHKAHKTLPDLEELRIGYGSSENGVIANIQTHQEALETRSLTVGPPLDLTELRIVDPATNEICPLGQSGEVQTRGFNTMVGYYKDPDKTDEVITKSRWYKSGDLGIIDRNGSLQIVGRIKDLIIKGGENIYPAEVETVLHKHPLIEDAHVIGVPDKRLGEEVCVWVKLNKTKCDSSNESKMREDIISYCKQHLTYFKVPKYVLFVEEFPMTPIKKIKKFEMRAQSIKMLNL